MTERTELQTPRLLLRPYGFEDVADVFAYAADEEWSRFLTIPRPYRLRDAEAYVAQAVLRDWAVQPLFSIVLDGRNVGSVGVRVNSQHRLGELGWGLARKHWGNGLIPEAAAAVIDWAFPAFELDKVCAQADARNTQSHRVMEKLGMTREACFRQHRLHRGERVDEVWYGLLREEWETRKP